MVLIRKQRATQEDVRQHETEEGFKQIELNLLDSSLKSMQNYMKITLFNIKWKTSNLENIKERKPSYLRMHIKDMGL